MAIFREITLSLFFRRVLTFLAAAGVMMGMTALTYIEDSITRWSLIVLFIYIYVVVEESVFSGSSDVFEVVYRKHGVELPKQVHTLRQEKVPYSGSSEVFDAAYQKRDVEFLKLVHAWRQETALYSGSFDVFEAAYRKRGVELVKLAHAWRQETTLYSGSFDVFEPAYRKRGVELLKLAHARRQETALYSGSFDVFETAYRKSGVELPKRVHARCPEIVPHSRSFDVFDAAYWKRGVELPKLAHAQRQETALYSGSLDLFEAYQKRDVELPKLAHARCQETVLYSGSIDLFEAYRKRGVELPKLSHARRQGTALYSGSSDVFEAAYWKRGVELPKLVPARRQETMRSGGAMNVKFRIEKEKVKTFINSAVILKPKTGTKQRCKEASQYMKYCRIEKSIMEKNKEKNSTDSVKILEPKIEKKQHCQKAAFYNSLMRSRRGIVPLTLQFRIEKPITKKDNGNTFIGSAMILEPKIEQKLLYQKTALYNPLMGIGGRMNMPLTHKLGIENSLMKKVKEKTFTDSAMILEPKIETKQQCQEESQYVKFEKSIIKKDNEKTFIDSAMILEPKIEQKRRDQETAPYNPPMGSGGGMNVPLTHNLRIENSLMEKVMEKTFTNSTIILEQKIEIKQRCKEVSQYVKNEKSLMEKDNEKTSIDSAMILEPKIEQKQQCEALYNPSMESGGGEMNMPLTYKLRIENSLMEKVKEKTSTDSAMILEPKIETKQRCQEESQDVKIEISLIEKVKEKTSTNSAIILEQKIEIKQPCKEASQHAKIEKSLTKDNEKASFDSAMILEPKIEHKREETALYNRSIESGGGMNVPLTHKLRIEKSVTKKGNEKTSIDSAMILEPKIQQKQRYQETALFNPPMESGEGKNAPHTNKLRIEKSATKKNNEKTSISSAMILKPKIEQKWPYQETALYNPPIESDGGTNVPLTHKLRIENFVTEEDNEKISTGNTIILEPKMEHKGEYQETELCNPQIGSDGKMNVPLTLNLRIEKYVLKKDKWKNFISSAMSLKPKIKKKQRYQRAALYNRWVEICDGMNVPLTRKLSAVLAQKGGKNALNIPSKRRHVSHLRIKKSLMKKDNEKTSICSAIVLEPKMEQKQQCQEMVLYISLIESEPLTHKLRIENFVTEKDNDKTSIENAMILESKIEHNGQYQEAELCNGPIGSDWKMNVPLALNLRIEKYVTKKDKWKTSISRAMSLKPKIKKKQRYQRAALYNWWVGICDEMNVLLIHKLSAVDEFKRQHAKKGEKNAPNIPSKSRHVSLPRIKISSSDNNFIGCAMILDTKMEKKRRLMHSSVYVINEYLPLKRLKIDEVVNGPTNYSRNCVEKNYDVNNEVCPMILD